MDKAAMRSAFICTNTNTCAVFSSLSSLHFVDKCRVHIWWNSIACREREGERERECEPVSYRILISFLCNIFILLSPFRASLTPATKPLSNEIGLHFRTKYSPRNEYPIKMTRSGPFRNQWNTCSAYFCWNYFYFGFFFFICCFHVRILSPLWLHFTVIAFIRCELPLNCNFVLEWRMGLGCVSCLRS